MILWHFTRCGEFFYRVDVSKYDLLDFEMCIISTRTKTH